MKFERVGGSSGLVAVAAIVTQFLLTGATPASSQTLLNDRMRWEWITLLRIVGGLGIVWFTAGLAARLRRFGDKSGPSAVVLGAGILWGTVWLLSATFNSAAISLATATNTAGVGVLVVLGDDSVLTPTPALSVVFLAATGAAVLASPTFPRRYGYMTLASAAFRLGLAIVDWYGGANLAMRIMDLTLLWVVVTAIHLLGATRPAAALPVA